MKLKYILATVFLLYLIRVLYLTVIPVEITDLVVSDCFEDGCVVFEGDWISFSGSEYTHEVFTDDLSLDPQVPYVEYKGKLNQFGNIYYLNEAHTDTKLYIAVKKSGEVSLLKLPWFVLYSTSNYLPVYRHVQKKL